jgi:type VI protein secretion system component VasF
MNKQPEALRLADAIEKGIQTFFPDFEPIYNAPAELRRLHEINQELLEALKDLEVMAERYRQSGMPIPDAQKTARAAILKATGESK